MKLSKDQVAAAMRNLGYDCENVGGVVTIWVDTEKLGKGMETRKQIEDALKSIGYDSSYGRKPKSLKGQS